MKGRKRTLIILIIILLALISFGGIFIQKTKFVENILPEFIFNKAVSGVIKEKKILMFFLNNV